MTLVLVLAISGVYVVSWAIVAVGKSADRDLHEALFDSHDDEHCNCR